MTQRPGSSSTRSTSVRDPEAADAAQVALTGLWQEYKLTSFDDELRREIKNIADRADRKYSRTAIATSLFLAALVVLAPTVVLGLAAAGQGSKDTALPWDPTVRWCVASVTSTVATSSSPAT